MQLQKLAVSVSSQHPCPEEASRSRSTSRCYRPAGIGHMAGCRLVTMLVGSRGRVGLVTPTGPNGHLPALFGGPFHVQLGECFLSVESLVLREIVPTRRSARPQTRNIGHRSPPGSNGDLRPAGGGPGGPMWSQGHLVWWRASPTGTGAGSSVCSTYTCTGWLLPMG